MYSTFEELIEQKKTIENNPIFTFNNLWVKKNKEALKLLKEINVITKELYKIENSWNIKEIKEIRRTSRKSFRISVETLMEETFPLDFIKEGDKTKLIYQNIREEDKEHMERLLEKTLDDPKVKIKLLFM